jgi:hypothetical protein
MNVSGGHVPVVVRIFFMAFARYTHSHSSFVFESCCFFFFFPPSPFFSTKDNKSKMVLDLYLLEFG